MQYISTLFTQSKAFVEMQVQAQRDQTLDFDTNLRHYKSVFFADFPKAKLLKIEKLKKQHPYLFQEIMVTANLSSLVKETEIDQHYDENVKLVAAYQKWIALTATD